METAGLLDEPSRVIIRVSGDRAPEMLHGLATNDINGLEPGQAAYAFMLTPKGRIVGEMRVIRLSDEIWLDMPASCRDSTLGHLRKYLPPMYAVFEQAELRRLAVIGPAAPAALGLWAGSEAGSELEPLRSLGVEREDFEARVLGRESIEGPGFDVYVSTDSHAAALRSLEDAVMEAGGRRSDAGDWEIRRVERGIPAYGVDFGESELAQELSQDDRAISFDKGCYTGQEVVARIHFRGHVNRILRGFRLPHTDLAPGQALYAGDRERGVLGSVVASPRFGPIALGFARAELSPGSRLALEPSGDPTVQVADLPF